MYLICWCIICIIFSLQINLVHNFNLDLHTYTINSKSPASMFGFSIAMHKTQEGGEMKNWLIVGAPKANVSDFDSLRMGVISPGVVYRCQLDDDNRCIALPFDQGNGNKYNTYNEQIDTKSNQWFGATVSSGGINKPIVACAPRYVFHGMQPSKVERKEPVGTCYVVEEWAKFREYSPCRTNFWGYHRQGYCQAGFSAAMSQSGDRVFIGAPGSWYWQGQVYSIHSKSEFPYKPGYYQPFGEAGQVYSLDPTVNTSQVYSTRESLSEDDDSYLGYSMTVGRLGGSNERNDVAVGMPRGNRLLGKVVIFTWDMRNLHNITGYQIGSYFGYALCAVDVDGDNLDDLIIGAPMFTDDNSRNEGKYDIGRIYIAFQGTVNKFERIVYRDGFRSRGRFGMALTALDDINKDGFKDFAVGAPYDGEFGGGAVYIYHGSKTGPTDKPVQVIYAEDMYDPLPRTFGFSLSGGLDLDNNNYPDLAVGAYESGRVYFFRARPVVNINTEMKFLSYQNKQQITMIDIEKNKPCFIDSSYVPCASLKLCIHFNNTQFNRYANNDLNFNITFKLDAKAKNPRMMSFDRSSTIIKRIPINQRCTEEKIYIKTGIQDKLTPMEVEVEYDIIDVRKSAANLIRDARSLPPPIVDQRSDSGRKISMTIQKNCGLDNICTPDLILIVNAPDEYVLDDKRIFEVNVTIVNNREDSFETKFYMNIPKGLLYKSTLNYKDHDTVQVTCSTPQTELLKCDIGNPFVSGGKAVFKVIFQVSEQYPLSFDFHGHVNSTNPEESSTMTNNYFERSVALKIETDFVIQGSTPSSYGFYKLEDYKKYDEAVTEAELGPEVIHAYNFRNNGSAHIGRTMITIAIPVETINKKPLMYVLNPPEIYGGDVKCSQLPPANPKNLKLDPELSTRSYLAQIGAKIAEKTDHIKFVQVSHAQSSQYPNTGAQVGSSGIVYTERERHFHKQDDDKASPGDGSYRMHTSEQPGNIYSTSSIDLSGAAQGHGGFRTGVLNTGREEHQGGGGQQGGHGSSYHSEGSHVVQPDGQVRVYHNGGSYVVQQAGQPDVYRSSDSYGREQDGQHGIYQGAGQQGIYQGGGQQGIYQGGGQQGIYQGGGQQGIYQGGGQQGIYQGGEQQGIYQGGRGTYGGSQQSGVYPSDGGRIHSTYHQTYGSPGNYNYNFSRSWHSDVPPGNSQFNRLRRDIHTRSLADEKATEAIRKTINCTAMNCFLMLCEIKKLESKSDAWISLRTRLVAETLSSFPKDMSVNISTMAAAAIIDTPYHFDIQPEPIVKTLEIVYTAIPEPEPKDDTIPLWIVILAACVGALILLLLAFLLYKCGFFRRNRPSDAQERQPLNRNGNYHGDEHL